jgi:XTP/dITP diphosphohydrolase
MEIYFATSNRHKFAEAKKMMEENGISIEQFEFSHNEIRSDSLEEIAIEAVQAAYKKIQKPVFVEDAGLFINSLNGFPGTYSGWVQKKIGNQGILKLLEAEQNRAAEFRAVIAFADGAKTKTFSGSAKGKIAKEQLGDSGFGYDPIFIPEGADQSFAQSIALKNKLSHRYNSLLKLVKYLERE